MTLKITEINKAILPLNREDLMVLNGLGTRWRVDSFHVMRLSKTGKSAEIMYHYKGMNMCSATKRLGFFKGLVFVKIDRFKYPVGRYEELEDANA